jgi:hypothetical protein
MSTTDWDRLDRSLERADGCVGCRRHTEECVCPTRLPVRLRLVHTDQPRQPHRLAAVHRLHHNDTRPGICGPEAA